MIIRSALRTALSVFLTVVPAIVSPAAAGLPQDKMDRAVRRSLHSGAATTRVIVTVEPGCRAGVRQTLERHGDRVRSEHPLIDALSGDIHTEDLQELAKQPCVRFISIDADVHAAPTAVRTLSPLKTGPAQVLTSTLRDSLGLPRNTALDPSVPTGAAGVTVAIIDSGIAPSADFNGRITGFYDFTRGARKSRAPYDDYGHGTHVAGLIGSSGQLSNFEFQGVAPDVHLVALKVLDHTGAGKTSDVINAIQFVIANKTSLNVQIINLSLGHPIYVDAAHDPLVQAVERASAAGLIVVTSAGNFGGKQSDGSAGYTGITSPGNAPSAITVGAAMTKDTAIRSDDAVAPYSSRGPTWYDAYAKPDVVAPGHHLASDTNLSSYLYATLQTKHGQAMNGQPLLELSGSSMAAGVTSGVVALMLQAHNESGFRRGRPLTPNLVKAMLQFSAIPIAGGDYLTQGAGQINAAGAIALGYGIDTSRNTGSIWLTGVPTYTVIGAETCVWSGQIIYGDNVLQGAAIYSDNVVWATNIVWGTAATTTWGANVIQAANIVWGTNAVWGTNIVWGTRVIGQRVDGTRVVWGMNIVWGTHIVWDTLTGENVVWGTMAPDDNIVWGTMFSNSFVWGTASNDDNIVWGTAATEDNIVWGTASDDDNIVWGTSIGGGLF